MRGGLLVTAGYTPLELLEPLITAWNNCLK